MTKSNSSFLNGHLTCCPLCENDNPSPYKLSREFGVMVYFCDICSHYSTWDLTHGIVVGDNKSNAKRCRAYHRAIKNPKYPQWKSILEVGPGDYTLALSLVTKKHKKEVTTIDVGDSFLDTGATKIVLSQSKRPFGWKKMVVKAEKDAKEEIAASMKNGQSWSDKERKDYIYKASVDVLSSLQLNVSKKIHDSNIKILSVPSPTTPDEIYDVSFRMKETLEKENRRWDLGVSLHSLEHSPEPVTMILMLDDLCDDFVIEVPDGTSKTGRGETHSREHGMFVDVDDPGPFPILPSPTHIVGGHYQLFTKESLIYIANHHLKAHDVYYVGDSIYTGVTTAVLTTNIHFITKGTAVKISKIIEDK